MIKATNLKNGIIFLAKGKPYKVIKYNHLKLGRGGAIVRITAKNLQTGAIEEETYSANKKIEETLVVKRKLQYLYSDGRKAIFINPKSFAQLELSADAIKDKLSFVKEGESVEVLFWSLGGDEGNDKPISIDIAPMVVLKIVDTAPGVKGNSASNFYKEATLENKLKVRVPLFIKTGDEVKVDTRTGEYVERMAGA